VIVDEYVSASIGGSWRERERGIFHTPSLKDRETQWKKQLSEDLPTQKAMIHRLCCTRRNPNRIPVHI
jgi:hypothetical protein